MSYLPESFDIPVVGVTFHSTYPVIAYELQELVPIRARLTREKNNPYDSNAILVKIFLEDKAGGEKLVTLGHVSRHMAKRLAPELDRDPRRRKWKAWVTKIEIHPDNPDNPGIWLFLKSSPVISPQTKKKPIPVKTRGGYRGSDLKNQPKRLESSGENINSPVRRSTKRDLVRQRIKRSIDL